MSSNAHCIRNRALGQPGHSGQRSYLSHGNIGAYKPPAMPKSSKSLVKHRLIKKPTNILVNLSLTIHTAYAAYT